MRRVGDRGGVALAGLAAMAVAALAGCPSKPPADEAAGVGSGSAETAAPAEGSAAPEAAAPAEGSAPTEAAAGEPAAAGEGSGSGEGEQSAVCGFVAAEAPIGGVRCPDGCVMVKAAQIDEARGCALVGPEVEVALACLRFPADVVQQGGCYVDEAGHHVVTSLHYPAVLGAGWTACPDDYPHRTVSPCPAPAAEGSAAAE